MRSFSASPCFHAQRGNDHDDGDGLPGGIFSQLFYIVIIVMALLVIFSWDQIGQAITMRPPGHSMINPLDSLETKDFNLFYVLIQLFLAVYGTMAWQNASAYNAAAFLPMNREWRPSSGGGENSARSPWSPCWRCAP